MVRICIEKGGLDSKLTLIYQVVARCRKKPQICVVCCLCSFSFRDLFSEEKPSLCVHTS